MIDLYPKQEEHAREIYRALLCNGAALDTSQTGTGKTPMSSHIARHWVSKGYSVAVVCPKSVVTQWERTLEQHGVTAEFVLNYEKLKNGKPGIVRIRRRMKKGKLFAWELPPKTLIIFDEVQWCKGAYTQNAQLLIAAKKQNYPVLALSATAAQDPTEMRALGYALGLHELNQLSNNNSWFAWMERNGCYRDPWRNWKVRKDADLSTISHELFDIKKIAHGLCTSDMPGAFKGQRILTDLGDYKEPPKHTSNQGLPKML